MKNSTGKRLKECRNKLGLTQEQLAESIGLKGSKIKDIETDRLKLTPEIASLIEQNYPLVDASWLIFGKSSSTQTTNPATIPITKVSALVSAGGGNHIEAIDLYSTGDVMHIDKGVFKTPPKNKLAMMKVDGQSMLPVLYPDSWVIFEEQSSFSQDGLYILNFDNTLMVKILQADPISGSIDIISSNKDYKSYTYNPQTSQISFYIIGKVLRTII